MKQLPLCVIRRLAYTVRTNKTPQRGLADAVRIDCLRCGVGHYKGALHASYFKHDSRVQTRLSQRVRDTIHQFMRARFAFRYSGISK